MNVLTIKQLSKEFHQESVLKAVDLQLTAGKVLVLLGKSGSGKSTLLKCINQLEVPSSGQIQVLDQHFQFGTAQAVSGKSLKWLRQQVGMVFQQYCLWPHLSVLKNLCLAPVKLKLMSTEAAQTKAMALLNRFQLSQKAHVKPDTLSGGQRQRVSLARTLMLSPKIILFDEPTSALDPEMTKMVLNMIQELKTDKQSMLISTHDIHFAKAVADEVVFLHNGSIQESGGVDIIDHPKTEAFNTFLTHNNY